MLITKSLIKKYKDCVIKYPDINIPKGKFTFLKGRNGSGKTTLLNIFSFISLKSDGKLYFDGIDTDLLSNVEKARIRRERIIYIPQNIVLIEYYNVLEMINFFNINEIKVYDMIEFFGFSGFENKKVGELSTGQLRRLQILCCLIKGGDLILADEILNDIDDIYKEKIISYFESLKGNKTIVVVDHTNNFNNLADNIIELS